MLDNESNHYATLGLDRRCTREQIRSAYRVLAKRHHPDLHDSSPEAVARAQELNAAYEILNDPAHRRAYDRELDAQQPQPAPKAKIERNIAQEVRLRVEEFLRGVELEIRVNDPANPNGAETYPLTIPPGTAPGARFRIPRDAPFEDGFINVRTRVFPSARFKARGSDLRCDLRINARRAAQGGSEMLPGPTGQMLRVAIPAGIARGEVLRIAGEGLPKARGGRGDLLVRITYLPEVRITRR